MPCHGLSGPRAYPWPILRVSILFMLVTPMGTAPDVSPADHLPVGEELP